ncbi:MAG: class II fructose-1,6-bisphosphate aldolase [Candidatus Bathyarchaeia archaeon]
MLVTNKDLLHTAKVGAYAVGAFNIQNLESLSAVVEAAVEEKSPVIVAVTPGAIKYAGLKYLAELVKIAAEASPVPMALHLDHGEDFETITKCLEAGFTSVMIDGSYMPMEDNVSITKRVVNLAHSMGVSVEAELGRISGVEEKTVAEREAVLTDPDEAAEFVRRTGVDALAVSIGTSHGAYKFKGEPQLDFERLRLISERVDVPLVLHGASSVPAWIVEKAVKYGAELAGARGIPEEHIRKAVFYGITKINIDTDLRLAFTATVREVLANSPREFDPRKILGPAKEAMKEVVKGKMQLFGSSGKAWNLEGQN